jgi:hypothetical protein
MIVIKLHLHVRFIGLMLTDSDVCSAVDRVLLRQDRQARSHNDSVLLCAHCSSRNLLDYSFHKQPKPSIHTADSLLHRLIVLHGKCVGSPETDSHQVAKNICYWHYQRSLKRLGLLRFHGYGSHSRLSKQKPCLLRAL